VKPARQLDDAQACGLVILDGPMGTELERRGVALPPPSWSARALEVAADVVAAVHREYAAVGATVHRANTFRTHRRSSGERWRELALRAVELARAHAGAGHRVAGSIGPLEDCYRPDLSPGTKALAEHRALATVLASTGVDLLFCETFPHPGEAAVAVEAAVETGVETWVALTPAPDGSLMSPAEMRAAARVCVSAGARAVLVNCLAARRTLGYVRELGGLGVPFGAYANAGRKDEGLGWAHAADPRAAEGYADLARTWIDAGATIVGGCCGTGPAHVEAVIRSCRRNPRAGQAPSS
jgi:S-methylmethionine-dependent homocysteine/selenocysteine methylase